MIRLYFISIFIFMFSSIDTSAQGLFDVELYGGPIHTYVRGGSGTNPMGIEGSGTINAHLGINLLTRLTDTWQVTLQGEMFRTTSIFTDTFSESHFSKNFGNIALGARYSMKRGNKDFFFQPSIGALPYREAIFQPIGYELQRKVSFTLRGEAGVKLYNKRDNYFLFGLRHQQGFDPLIHHDFTDLRFSQYGSYTGLVIGYGINSGKRLR